MPPRSFYITTPIYYVNGAPHIGHAYTSVAADAIARYHRVIGDDVHLLTGTDEHGQKIERSAAAAGLSPQGLADANSDKFRALWPLLSVVPSDFIRTTQARHVERVQKWWRASRAAGDLYKGTYRGLYCVACEGPKTEKDLLPGGLCNIHERPVETFEEETWMFRLSNYRERLLRHYEEHPEFIQPESRRNEIIAQVREGLDDLSVSRSSFTWGIPVPEDPGHVIYVWFDALFNYLTAVDGADRWPADIHLVAKDILRFHAVYWPAFLMSVGLPLPRTIWAHGYLLAGDRKIAKTPAPGTRTLTTGTTDPFELALVLGPDLLRYYLLRDVAFGQDGAFSIPEILNRARTELASTVGNLLHRTLPFVVKYFGGVTPGMGDKHPSDNDLESALEKEAEAVQYAWEDLTLHQALAHTIEMARAANRYFDNNTPWILAKEGHLARLATVVTWVLRILQGVAVMLWPVIPGYAEEILRQMGEYPLGTNLTPGKHHWVGMLGRDMKGLVVAPGHPVFPRFGPEVTRETLLALGVEESASGKV